MSDRDPWERLDADGPAAGEPTSDPWDRPASAAPSKPQGQWGPLSEALNGVLMGAGPTLTGAGQALRGNDFGAAKTASEQARDAYEKQNPGTSTAASFAGSAVPAIAMAAMGVPPIAGGMIQGGAPGVFNNDPGQALAGTVMGGLGTAAAGAIGKAATGLGRMTGILGPAAATAPAIPAGPALKALGGDQATQLRDMGATVDPTMIRSTLNDAVSNLQARGMYESAPTTKGLIRQTNALAPVPVADPMAAMTGVAPPAPQGVPLATLDNMRSEFGGVQAGQNISPRDAAAAAQVKNAILDLYQNPAAISGADPAAVGALSATSRGNSHAGLMSETLNNYATNAENGAQATGTGKNIDNKYRQQATSLLNPVTNKMAGFPQPVVDAVQAVNDGSRTQNILRDVAAKLGGGGGPLSTMLALGTGASSAAATGSPWGALLGALIPAAGAGAKALENRMSARAMQAADEAARMTSPAYRQAATNFVPPATGGLGSVFGNALAPAIGAATANPGMGALFGN